MAKIALCVIATNDYIDFIQPLLVSADKYFLQGHEVVYHIFLNKRVILAIGQRDLYHHPIVHEPWPVMTLKRYHIMSGVDLSGYDYCYYIDADMRFVAPVGDEIFGELVGVQHPGFYRGGGSWETNPESSAYIQPSKRIKYIAGGFQGGSKYIAACSGLKINVDRDAIKYKVKAVHNDESHWNKLYTMSPHYFTLLSPSYCMVEEPAKRKAWGIDHLEPKIIALAKDHKKYQK
jgi:hypothetical protein